MDAMTFRTTTRPATGRTILVALTLAVLAALLATQGAGATPKGGQNQKNHEQRAGDFADGCKSAGGTPETVPSTTHSATLVECDFGDYAVGCVFYDTPYETYDVCADSRGITGAAGTRAAPIGDGVATTEGSGDAGGSTIHAGTHAAPGGRTILAADDDQP